MDDILVRNEINSLTNIILSEVDNFSNPVASAFGGRNKIGRTQLNSLLMNVKNASSVEELKLFIKYKESKDGSKGWGQVFNNVTVAQRLINSITNVENLYKKVRITSPSEDDITVLKLMLVEKFLGYLYWKGTILAH